MSESECVCTSCQTLFRRSSSKSAKCSECLKARTRAWHARNKERASEYRKKYYYANKEKVLEVQKARYLNTTFGLTTEEYNNKRAEASECEICKSPLLRPQLDHCHTSGSIRGWLCGSCNKALGLFKDSTKTLEQAIKYLEKHAGN